jgi:hypothetical protein
MESMPTDWDRVFRRRKGLLIRIFVFSPQVGDGAFQHGRGGLIFQIFINAKIRQNGVVHVFFSIRAAIRFKINSDIALDKKPIVIFRAFVLPSPDVQEFGEIDRINRAMPSQIGQAV